MRARPTIRTRVLLLLAAWAAWAAAAAASNLWVNRIVPASGATSTGVYTTRLVLATATFLPSEATIREAPPAGWTVTTSSWSGTGSFLYAVEGGRTSKWTFGLGAWSTGTITYVTRPLAVIERRYLLSGAAVYIDGRAVTNQTSGDQYVPAADWDADQIPDDWERLYGLSPTNAADAQADGDTDGVRNLGEYLAATIPTNGASYLGIASFSLSNGTAFVHSVGSTGAVRCLVSRPRLTGPPAETCLGSNNPPVPAAVEFQVPVGAAPTNLFLFMRPVR